MQEIWPKLEQAFEHGVQSHRRKLVMGKFGEEETRAILHLTRWVLTFQPEGRPRIEEVLKYECMVKKAMPEL